MPLLPLAAGPIAGFLQFGARFSELAETGAILSVEMLINSAGVARRLLGRNASSEARPRRQALLQNARAHPCGWGGLDQRLLEIGNTARGFAIADGAAQQEGFKNAR